MTVELIYHNDMILTISSGSTMRDSIKKMAKQQSNIVPKLADRKKTVLRFVARMGEANIYQISEECKIRYSTAHSSVESLKKEGLLQLKSKILNKKGVPATFYGLTPKGLHRSIFDLPTWHEKIVIAEKWQDLLNPNVIEWMKFIEALNDQKTQEMVNTDIGSFLCCSDDLGFFVDVINDIFFDALLATMIEFNETYSKVMRTIGSFPRLKERLLKLLEQDIAWREEDLEKHRMMKAEFEKL